MLKYNTLNSWLAVILSVTGPYILAQNFSPTQLTQLLSFQTVSSFNVVLYSLIFIYNLKYTTKFNRNPFVSFRDETRRQPDNTSYPAISISIGLLLSLFLPFFVSSFFVTILFYSNSDIASYHSIRNHLSSRLLSKNIKTRICKTIILPVVLYGCET
jgi:hypothetical protein